jgi:uncharacterized RDD family membrane protein YckC
MSFAAPRPPELVGIGAEVDADAEAAEAVVPARYVGLVTRALAFAVDAAIVNAVAILVTAVVGLALSVIAVPEAVRDVTVLLGGVAYVLWSVGYFVGFWAATGQTPGARMLRFRVCTAAAEPLRPRRGLVRFAGLLLAALPLFAGFLLILVDDRRRGLHDRLAGTVVVELPERDAQRPRGRGTAADTTVP